MTANITRRQIQHILLAGYGWENREIALILGITEYSVDRTLNRAYGNLKVHTRQEALKKLKEIGKW